MNRLFNLKFCILILLVLPGVLVAQYERPGSASGQFLKIGVSPKATALGNSYIANTRVGAEAVYYNPAALPYIDNMSFTATHLEYFADVSHDFFAAARNFGRLGSFGLSLTSFRTDPMKVRTPLQPEGTGETFALSNYQVGLSYARSLTDHVTFGGTLKYVRMMLYADFVQSAYATDISILYTTGFRGFSFGMKIANFGSSVSFVNEQYPLPLGFSFGMKMNALEMDSHRATARFSVLKPNDGQTLLRGGLEWSFHDLLYARAGYHFNHDMATFAFGGGLNLDISQYQVGFDYAYADYQGLGAVNQFGIDIGF